MILLIFPFQLYYIQSTGAIPGELKASPLATQLTAELGSNTSLACASTSKPILCLWKTPYGHVYTLSEGVFAESGRLRHEVLSEAGGQGCGLQVTISSSSSSSDCCIKLNHFQLSFVNNGLAFLVQSPEC